MFKVGDKVRLKPAEELEFPHWKAQEVGVGIITRLGPADPNWCSVQWENDEVHGYRHQGPVIDLIKVKEEPSKMPTKEQVFEAIQKCPEAKAALEILFPEYFEESKREAMVSFKRGTYFKSSDGVIAMLALIGIDTWSFIEVRDGSLWFFPISASQENCYPQITLERFYDWINQDEYNWTPIKVDIVERIK